MTTSVRSVATALLALALSATAACAGGTATTAGDGDDRTADDRAVAAGQSYASTAPEPAAAPNDPVTLPMSASGRTAVFSHGPRSREDRTVALTFDADMTADQADRAADGERFDNPELVEALREAKVPATFFMTGMWARTYPDQARSIDADELFEVANHSYAHYAFTGSCYGLPELAPKEQRADVEKGFAALRRAGVRDPLPYFRFPGGCYDDRALRAVAPTGVTAVQWDVMSGDPFNEDADDVAQEVLSGVQPGSVVVMHCTRSAAPATVEALRKVVPELRERGYRFVRVSEMIADAAS